MRKKLFTVLAVFLLALVTVMPAAAITNNYVTDNEHPFVGLIVFYDANGQFVQRCSGALIGPTKFLTAGHCVDPNAGVVTARVYFQQDAGAHYDPTTQQDPVTGYPDFCAASTLGTLCATSSHLYSFGFPGSGIPETRDAGLVILDQAIQLPEYGQLPAAGTLDALSTARGQTGAVFTSSGYGLSYKPQAHSVLPPISFRVRLMAVSTLVNLNSFLTDGYNLQAQGNGDERGGTCSGDSGGPVFLGGPDSNLIVAVTSFGLNTLCRGTDFSYRIDRTEVLNWINNPTP